MQELNWGIFKAKFFGKEHAAFQRLCYHLFLSEHNRPLGVFAFKNQAGIETNPLETGGEVVGFQAKYFDARLSERKQNLIDAIAAAKQKNSALTRILFYLNQEFPESSHPHKKDPAFKIEIEESARLAGIAIEWRVPTHFEAQLATPANAHLAEYFFSNERSVVDLLEELRNHSEAILTPIRTSIPFNGAYIKIDRRAALTQLTNGASSTHVAVVAGTAGAGKTAIIKDLASHFSGQVPFYVFRATEFNIGHANELFAPYGSFNATAFIEAHAHQDVKYVVIDSAEKLSDIVDKTAFQDFLSMLIAHKWKVVLTTRYGYLSDLQFLLVGTYGLQVHAVLLNDLSADEVALLASQYTFQLPANGRLRGLLRNPFYLGEYLRYYASLGNAPTYSSFRDMLWQRQVARSADRKQNTHRLREETFIGLALQRANQGHMYVKSEGFDGQALSLLEADEIIGFDATARGYFITHDIYEEWAIEKFIDQLFATSPNAVAFLQQLGTSLAVRRSLRLWVTERLSSGTQDVYALVVAAMTDGTINAFWRDEVCVATLLSPYAGTFVQSFEAKLLEDEQQLLVRLIFLLRLACKDVDETTLTIFGLSGVSPAALKFIFTMPKGGGWDALIAFAYNHRRTLRLRLSHIVVPMLTDWTAKYKTGSTTRHASLIALYYYQELAANNGIRYNRREDFSRELVKVILNGATEISSELTAIFDDVLSRDHIGYRDPYFSLIQVMLSSPVESMETAKCLPLHVLKLATKCWQAPPEPDEWWQHGSHIGVEHDFGLADTYHMEYFPSSPFHTPILALLQHAPKETIEFIVSFMNSAIDHYATSDLSREAETVALHLDGHEPQDQYISHRLWCTYRGTQVSTHLLESIHMAVERWLLGIGETASAAELEGWCLALLENSKSASLTAVVVSLILAYPYKLFRIAAMLAKTMEFFWYDTARMVADQTHKSSLEGLQRSFPSGDRKFYENERITTCDEPHRKQSFEMIVFKYQILQVEGESEADVRHRQEVLWAIWDEHYAALDSDVAKETDKSWRLLLARLDTRKMSLKHEEINGHQAITFQPDIDPELKRFSEESLRESAESMKYLSLRTWAQRKFLNESGECKKYPQYQDDPDHVLTMVREVVEGLRNSSDEKYRLFNGAIPAYACTVLLRDFYDQLTPEARDFCKGIVVEYASAPVRVEHYSYQVGDGVEPTVYMLPTCLHMFPQDRQAIQTLIFLLLLSPYGEISGTLTWGIYHQLWQVEPAIAHEMFVGYLLLKPAYEASRDEVRKQDIKKQRYEHSEQRVVMHFEAKHGKLVKKAVAHQLGYSDVGDLTSYNLGVLVTAFELLPVGTPNAEHQHFINTLFPLVTPRLFEREPDHDHPERDIYALGRLRKKIAYFVLGAPLDAIPQLIAAFVAGFRPSREAAEFLSEFISAEDRLATYDAFWTVWNAFYVSVAAVASAERPAYDSSNIIHHYLLAWPYWKGDARKWHSLREREKSFYRRAASDMGKHPATLDALAKLLNEIGSEFIVEGIGWISSMLESHRELQSAELEINTVYYLENLVKRFALQNHRLIKTSKPTATQVLVILNFLVSRGSITGYLLREDII